MCFESISKSECARELLACENPLIVMHIRPDGDTVGSAAGLCQVFLQLGKSPKLLCDDKIPERLAFLTAGLDFAEKESELSAYDVITIDVASPTQLGTLRDRLTPRLMIDHHEIGEPFAKNYILKGESSAGEVLFTVVEELVSSGKLKLTKEIAFPIYAAISSDTGSFRFSNTAPLTMRRVAQLMETGIDYSDINHRLFFSKSKKEIMADGFAATKIQTAEDGKIAYASISRSERESLGVELEFFDGAIDVVRSLCGCEIAILVKENDRGEFKGSLRSRGANVAEIARKFSGGGHIRAAGCSVKADNAHEAVRILVEEAKRIV